MNLTQASNELFQRSPDERFESLDELLFHCTRQRESSAEYWQPTEGMRVLPLQGRLGLTFSDGATFALNDWSFGQACRLASVPKETVNRLSADTASRVLCETLPVIRKPLQLYGVNDQAISIHGTAYTRLYNAEVLSVVREYAVDFTPPPKGFNGATGLYAGEQDLFAFLIDPMGWIEIGGQAFAPGFFVWNSEVGRRTLGISTFWFQAVCQNHIVWDATDVCEFTRKHTANVHEALVEVRRMIEQLIERRDARRDGFASLIERAMDTKLGGDADEVKKALIQNGIARNLAERAIESAEQQGRFTVFALVDALTRLAREYQNAGSRSEADQQAARLLTLAA